MHLKHKELQQTVEFLDVLDDCPTEPAPTIMTTTTM